MKGQRLIIGVAHVAEEELNQVKNFVSKCSPSNVGLELPEDHKQRKEYGISTFFFSDLDDYLESIKIEVLCLESPVAWNAHHTADIARSVMEGKTKKEDLEMELRRMNSIMA